MKVQHIESGLGNQMLGYAEYLALKKMNPNDIICIENIIYSIEECNEVICQWNGYELERIFHLDLPNVQEYFTPEIWKSIIDDIKKTKFWQYNWNYPVFFTEVFRKYGLELDNMGVDFDKKTQLTKKQKLNNFLSKKTQNRGGYFIRKIISQAIQKKQNVGEYSGFFPGSSKDCFYMQRLNFKNRGVSIDKIEIEIREAFTFPDLKNQNNIEIARRISHGNSVAIHARRGDMLSINGECYLYGYFKRAVRYIKKHVDTPQFYFFCDPKSVEWCKENYKIFGLDSKKDDICFVDWNDGLDSYVDMQLMSMCKHNIITNSSFGWWGSYLNNNPDKITISPYAWLNTTKTIF